MKKYLRFYIKPILIVLHFVILFILIWGLSLCSVKNIMTSVIISDFKSKGVLNEELSTNTCKYYKVETSNPNEEPSFIHYAKDRDFPGMKADILISTEAHLVNDLVSNFISYTVGGHAAMCVDSSIQDGKYSSLTNDYIVEATGMEDGENPTIISNKYYWTNNQTFNSMLVLRTNATKEQKDEVISNTLSMVDDLYNFSFLFNTKNRVYCSDLISKAYNSVGINLNKDGFQTTVYDLIVSSETYLSYYHYYEDGIKYIYYLGDYTTS